MPNAVRNAPRRVDFSHLICARLVRLTCTGGVAATVTACATLLPHGASDTNYSTPGHASAPTAPLHSLGTLPHPALKGHEARALQDLNRMIAEGETLFDMAQGAACAVPWTLSDQDREAIRAQGYGEPQPPLAYQVSMISGACPTLAGPGQAAVFAGPVEYLEHQHQRHQFGADMYSDMLHTNRVSAVFVGGQPTGENTTLRRMYVKTFQRLNSGEVIQQKVQGYDSNQPTYQVTYLTRDGKGELSAPAVSFSYDLGHRPGKLSVTVTESTGPGRALVTQIEGGRRTSLMRMRDGMLHGWTEYFDPVVVRAVGGRQCYQRGQLIKATECPD